MWIDRSARGLVAPSHRDLRSRRFFLLRVNLVLHPDLDAFAFFLEAGAEVARPIFEKHEEAKGEKDEKNHPEKRAN